MPVHTVYMYNYMYVMGIKGVFLFTMCMYVHVGVHCHQYCHSDCLEDDAGQLVCDRKVIYRYTQ